jgi:glutathione S-transferase
MLELYHHGSSVCAAKVRWGMVEKGLDFDAHYIDILKGEQFDSKYLKLNPKGVVPTLVHDGNVIIESTVILEYLDLVYPENRLTPEDPMEFVRTRYWTKALDEYMHTSCGALTFASTHRHIVRKNLSPDELEEFLANTPSDSVTKDWSGRKKQLVAFGFEAPGVADMVRMYDDYLRQMNEDLQQTIWLVGDDFGLADVSLTPYVNRIAMMGMSEWWEHGRYPYLEKWWERIQARKTFKSSILDWCPADLTDDLMTFGSQSWPEVKPILLAITQAEKAASKSEESAQCQL